MSSNDTLYSAASRDIDRIREYHYPIGDHEPLGCYSCGAPWPCDTSQVLALADELAEALWSHEWCGWWHKGVVLPDKCPSCAALAKWEASRAK